MMEEQVAKVDKKIGTPLWKESSQQPRPIVARLTHYKMNSEKRKGTEGTTFFINEQYSGEIMDRMRLL